MGVALEGWGGASVGSEVLIWLGWEESVVELCVEDGSDVESELVRDTFFALLSWGR